MQSVVGGAEVTAVALVEKARPHVDELREIFVERAEAVIDPRTDGRLLRVEHVTAGMELHLRAVVVIGRPHRAHDGEVVHAGTEVGKPVAHLDAALAAGREADLQRVNLVALLAVGVVHHDHAHTLALLRVVHALERRFVEGFAGVLGELGLGVEALHVTQAAAQENPDDRLRPRREVRQARGRPPTALQSEAIAREHRAQCEAAEAQAGAGEEGSARPRRRFAPKIC